MKIIQEDDQRQIAAPYCRVNSGRLWMALAPDGRFSNTGKGIVIRHGPKNSRRRGKAGT